MIFNMFKKNAADVAKRISGRTDILEAAAAMAARVAAKDGKADNDEAGVALEAIKSIDLIAGAFSEEQIAAAVAKEWDLVSNPIKKFQTKKQIEDIKNADQEVKELVLLVGFMVAQATGGMGDDERQQLLSDAKLMNLGNAAQVLAEAA
jgi:tellurite resistance protein